MKQFIKFHKQPHFMLNLYQIAHIDLEQMAAAKCKSDHVSEFRAYIGITRGGQTQNHM